MQSNKKAIYNVKGKPTNRLVIVGVQNKKQAYNLLAYVAQRKQWALEQIRVQVKRCTC